MTDRHAPRPWLHIGLAALICVLGVILVQREVTDNVPFADEVEYVTMAHNLIHRGVLSLQQQSSAPPTPTAYREPGYPILLAALMVLDRDLAAITLDCLTSRDTICAPAYATAKQLNLAMLLLTGLLVWFVTWRLTSRPWVAHVALLICIANLELHEYTTYLVSDFLALLLITIGSASLYFAGTKSDWRWGLAAGGTLGLLVLTKGAFVLLAPLVVLVVVICAIRASPDKRRRLIGVAILFVVGHGVVIGTWITRNWIELGAPILTQRGGHVLAHRVELNTMTTAEYGVAFLWWTRGFGDNLARKLVDVEHYTRFELRDPNGFYNAAQTKWIAAVADERQSGVDQYTAEAAAGRDMRDAIVDKWFKNLLVTLPVGYRGLFIDEFIVLTFPSLLLLVFSRRKRNSGFLWFALPGLYGLVFHAGLTLHLPRHAIPLLPTLAIAGSIGMSWLVDWYRDRKVRRVTTA